MLKRILFCLLLAISAGIASAQVLQPAKLVAETPSKSYKVGDVIELVFKASIQKNWYIYSVGFDPDCGPVPMSVTLDKDPSFEFVGSLAAIQDKTKHDKIFDCDVRIFEGSGEFRQKIKILSPALVVKGTYEGQVCSEVEGKCVLFDGDLTFGAIKVEGTAITSAKQDESAAPKTDDQKTDEKVPVKENTSTLIDTVKTVAAQNTSDNTY